MKPSIFQSSDAEQQGWSIHLRDLFEQLDISGGSVPENLIASISLYCQHHHPQGVQTADLKLLIARAFCAVGDRAAAERVLQSMKTHRRHYSRWLEILTELHHFPELLPYFSRGIIRPADWAGAQMDRMWILDFGRLSLSDAEQHEMMLYRSVRAIIEKMSVFWDAVAGEGTLGLKNLGALNIESGGQRQSTLMGSKDLVEYIADLFDYQKRERGWSVVPSLLNLDL